MTNTKRHAVGILFAAALLSPAVLIVGCSSQQTNTVSDRDRHPWDDHENQAWHRFLAENHRQEHEFTRADDNEQKEYWSWRHTHPD